jgi:hypothetical protein
MYNQFHYCCYFFHHRITLKRDRFRQMKLKAADDLPVICLISALWEIVEPFYYQPVSVPYGELDILILLFPELCSSLPVSEHQCQSTFHGL